jgi:hypothetical protein
MQIVHAISIAIDLITVIAIVMVIMIDLKRR